jgi:polyhydroxybutyrate depolymerase
MRTACFLRLVLPTLIVAVAAPFSNSAESSSAPRMSGGDHSRTVVSDGKKRTYLVHVPPAYNAEKPTPVVLALHGAGMDGAMMAWFCGLNQTSDKSGFVVVYPSGTGTGPFRTWNAGGFEGRMAANKPDDVAFIRRVLDDLRTVVNVDATRVYACGMSNGAMMCYRLAAELSDRIAAIAPVAGTIAIGQSKPERPVSVLHFHGTADAMVPYARSENRPPGFMRLKDVNESVQTWVKLNGCGEIPKSESLTREGEWPAVMRSTYSGGRDGAEVILVVIDGGGHTWPGKKPPFGFLGKSTLGISANQLMWEFFQRHRLSPKAGKGID